MESKPKTQEQLAVRTVGFPTTREREFRRSLRRRVRAMASLTEEAIEGVLKRFGDDINERARADAARADAGSAEIITSIIRVVSRVQVAFDQVLPIALGLLEKQAAQLDLFTTQRTLKFVDSVPGITVPLIGEAAEDLHRAFAIQQAGRIEAMGADYFSKVQTLSIRGLAEGKSTAQIRAALRKQFGMSARQATFIARDSTGTLNGLISQRRQQDLGVEEYVWSTSQDIRVRDEHVDREGKTFKWSDPPSDGHPGIPPNCRCTAQPKL